MELSKNVSNDEKLFAMLIYVSSFFTVFIGPLIIWLIKSDSEFVKYHGKEYFNFLISYTIYGIVSSLLMFIIIGFITTPILGIMGFIFTIMAAIKSYDGQEYRIPLVIRFIK